MITPLRCLCASALCAAVLVPSLAAGDDAQPRTIRVHGEASVKVAPDRARVSVSVVSRAASAKEASESNARASKEVLARLREAVKAPGEVRTAGYDLAPQYDYSQERGPGRGPTLVGYAATNRFAIETADLEGLGALLDAAVSAGASQVDSIGFFLENEEAVRAQALLEAGRKARTEAETVARSLGVAVGEVLDASTGGDVALPIPRGREKAMAFAAADAVATEVVPGTLEIRAGVSVAFAIR